MRTGDQGGAGGYVEVIVGHRFPIGRRKPIQGNGSLGGQLQKALAEVPYAVVVAVARDGVDVTRLIRGRTAPRLPERTGVAIRRAHVDARLPAQIRGVVTEHPAVVRILVAMGAKGGVHDIVGQQKTGALRSEEHTSELQSL